MKVAIRTDASVQIGTGHVMRCLTLADQLRSRGAEVLFLSRELRGHQCTLVTQCGFEILRLTYSESDSVGLGDNLYAQWLAVPMEMEIAQSRELLSGLNSGLDWLVLDHYALGAEWEKAMRPLVRKILVVDDLANRLHDCELLLDQNMHMGVRGRYRDLLPDHCAVLSGPKYSLLRPEFTGARNRLSPRSGAIDRVLVFFGGSDPSNETSKAITALARHSDKIEKCDVVVGRANPFVEQVKALCNSQRGFDFHCDIDNMAELMAKADLAIGAPGTTTWERCCVGLPSLLMAIADNQISIGQSAQEAGFARYLGESSDITVEYLAGEIGRLLDEPRDLSKMSRRGMALVDGKGAGLVCDAMLSGVLEGAAQ